MLKVTCAIIIQNGKMLITQRGADSDHPLQWEFPGGKVTENESEEDCIIREIREELNIELVILLRMTPVEYDYGFKLIQLIPFLCEIESDEIRLNEHHDFKWVTEEQIRHIDLSEADRVLIKRNENRDVLKKYLGENMHNTG